jgi:hypothetical protein
VPVSALSRPDQPAPKANAVKPVKFALNPVPITFAELMAEAGLTEADSQAQAQPQAKTQAFAITPPKTKAAPELITFSQLRAEAAEKRAI